MCAEKRDWRKSALGAALAVVVLCCGMGEASAQQQSLFGSREIRSSKIEKFKKWTELVRRYSVEAPNELKPCRPSPTNPCHIARWRIFLNGLKGKPQLEQLRAVNDYVNRWPYKLDNTVYNKSDYWATPSEFFQRSGDCEDYSFAKYVSLLHLGFDKNQLRLVVLNDLNLGIPHAVLAVYLEGQPEPLILDSQIKQIVPSSRIKHYRPLYSINEFSWWLHR